MSFRPEDIIASFRDTRQLAELVSRTIENHLEKAEAVKKQISSLITKYQENQLNILTVSGEFFISMLEVVSLASEESRKNLIQAQEKLEESLIAPARSGTLLLNDIVRLLRAFYVAYSEHYSAIFNTQVKSLFAIQSTISKAGEKLAKIKYVQDSFESNIDKAVKKEEDYDDGF